MKKKWKQLLSATMISALVVASLSACGAEDTVTETTSNDEVTENTEAVVDSDDDKVITFWYQASSEVDLEVYGTAIEIFNETNEYGYTIEGTNISNDVYKEKITIAMSSGECPDMYTSWSGGPMNEYADSGYAADITDLFVGTEAYDTILDAAIAQATYDDAIYAIPLTDISISGVFYNTEMFEELGLEVPETISELEAVCDTLLENGITPFALANANKWTGSMYFMNLAARYGGLDPFASAVSGEGTFEDDCFIYAGEKIQEWVEAGYFAEGINSMDEDLGQSRQLLYQETCAMQVIGSWQSGTISGESEEFYEKLGWFEFPYVDGKEEYADIAIGTVGDQFLSFNCSGEKLEAGVEFGCLFSTDEMVELLASNSKNAPVEGVAELVTDPSSIQVLEYVESAGSVQLWYDQYLSSAVATVHLDTCQALFGLTTTPEQAAADLEAAMEADLAE